MKIGLYTHDLYRDGQVGTGTSKYVFYLLRELEQLGVDIVRLEKGANPEDVDVVHDPHCPWSAPFFPRCPLVSTLHDVTPFTQPKYYGQWVRWLFAQKVRWFARRSRRMIVDSRITADLLGTVVRIGIPIDVIPLGVEDRFRPIDVPPPSAPFLLHVGIHRRIKEPMTTLRAFEAVADRVPHELHFVGGSVGYGEELRAYAASRPALRDRVKVYWPGEAGIPSLYNQASLVVHPCPEEGFGFVPVEAIACGAHVLARAPAVREALGPHGCYFVDERELPERIIECLERGPPGTREDRLRHARRYTFRAMAEATLRSYEAAVE